MSHYEMEELNLEPNNLHHVLSKCSKMLHLDSVPTRCSKSIRKE